MIAISCVVLHVVCWNSNLRNCFVNNAVPPQPSLIHFVRITERDRMNRRMALSDLAGSRRWFLQAASAATLASRMGVAAETRPSRGAHRSVIMFWLSGGPSQLDMWDPKPDAPSEIRGPFGSIETRLPGVRLSEHFPLQAALADKLSFLRSVDCSASNHTPITLQAGNPLAKRSDDGRDGGGYPSIGSVVAKFKGPNHPDLPPFVGLAPAWKADVWEAGHMGAPYAPVDGLKLVGKFGLPQGVQVEQLHDRDALRRGFDRLRSDIDRLDTLDKLNQFQQQAYEMVLGGHVQRAFDIELEPQSVRDMYGHHTIGQKALLARRLVEAGVTYVLVSGAWGYFDHHGDSVNWGGIEKGLKPLLPHVDQTVHALVTDLAQRGLLDQTLVLMLGEFGRSPVINKDAGRDHWTNVMSMVAAGGGLKHGQAVGATDARGGEVKEGLIRPQDLAATVFRFLGIDLSAHWTNPQGRPTPIVVEGGRPIPELFA
jgi:hypothetical protein